jgi:hypothetical protein
MIFCSMMDVRVLRSLPVLGIECVRAVPRDAAIARNMANNFKRVDVCGFSCQSLEQCAKRVVYKVVTILDDLVVVLYSWGFCSSLST